jgi:hypothetical protein
MSAFDEDFIAQLQGQLERFKVVQRAPMSLYNFRCPDRAPFCGDSHRNTFKARAYFYTTPDGDFHFKCHNCGLAFGLRNFLKEFDYELFREYEVERLKEEGVVRTRRDNTDILQPTDLARPLPGIPEGLLQPVNALPPNDPVVSFIRKRKIPKKKWELLYKLEESSSLGRVFPKYADRINGNETRLVLPVYDQGGQLIGLNCRAIDTHSLRYVAIRIAEGVPMVFGLDRVHRNRDTYVVEGAIDSLFLSNAVAVSGADLDRAHDLLSDDAIYVWDNEPRNKQIVQKMRRFIEEGRRVCIWPRTVGKDINDMVMNGWSSQFIERVIQANADRGLSALVRWGTWKRVEV